MTNTTREILEAQEARKRKAVSRSFYTIKGFDTLLGGTYENDTAYSDRDKAQSYCRRSEWVVEWKFSHEQRWMDNSTDMIYINDRGEERKRPGMFAHGDAC